MQSPNIEISMSPFSPHHYSPWSSYLVASKGDAVRGEEMCHSNRRQGFSSLSLFPSLTHSRTSIGAARQRACERERKRERPLRDSERASERDSVTTKMDLFIS